MLKLLIVDDEMVILHGIVKFVGQGKTPFTHIESALDAKEALALMERFRPDLVITDINMPEMNGLDFIEEVKRRKLCQRFIILTGHDDFSYAKQAIRIKVIEYLLKPINKMELWDLLKKVAQEIIDEGDAGQDDGVDSHASFSFHVSRMLDCIENHYQQDLSLETMADLTNLNPNYISQLFKKETGISFIQYLQEHRISKAKEILAHHPLLSIQVVGNQVGYENPQHFMKVFKKVTGCTPGTYREQNQREL